MDATKNPNLVTTHNYNDDDGRHATSLTSSQGFNRTHHDETCMNKLEKPSGEHVVIGQTETAFLAAGEDERKSEKSSTPPPEKPDSPEKMVVQKSGREKLKRHRVEMSGRVWIPDKWGQEDLLKKWIDCTVFDSSLEKSRIMLAREALIQEGTSTLNMDNRVVEI